MLEECQEERDDKNALATLLATLPNTLLGSAAPDRRWLNNKLLILYILKSNLYFAMYFIT